MATRLVTRAETTKGGRLTLQQSGPTAPPLPGPNGRGRHPLPPAASVGGCKNDLKIDAEKIHSFAIHRRTVNS